MRPIWDINTFHLTLWYETTIIHFGATRWRRKEHTVCAGASTTAWNWWFNWNILAAITTIPYYAARIRYGIQWFNIVLIIDIRCIPLIVVSSLIDKEKQCNQVLDIPLKLIKFLKFQWKFIQPLNCTCPTKYEQSTKSFSKIAPNCTQR